MDELDEFNEAPHIVHGDVIHPSTDVRRNGKLHDQQLHHPDDEDVHSVDLNGDMSIDLLDDDDEDIVLSTDDLLIGGTAGASDNHHTYNLQRHRPLRVNGDLSDAIKSGHTLT